MIDKINVRVYGICVKDRKILTLFEMYAGEKLIKLPGGGLEYGEGTLECLGREFREELSLEITNIRHFYTQDDFLISRFRENEQLLTVYYLVDIVDENQLKITDSSIEKAEWLPIDGDNPFNLPIDKRVFEILKSAL